MAEKMNNNIIQGEKFYSLPFIMCKIAFGFHNLKLNRQLRGFSVRLIGFVKDGSACRMWSQSPPWEKVY